MSEEESQTLNYVVLCSRSPSGEEFRGDTVLEDVGNHWLKSELGRYDDRWLEAVKDEK